MMRKIRLVLLVFMSVTAAVFLYWKYAIPTHRIVVSSELMMLGDLDGDNRWTDSDIKAFNDFSVDPFSAAPLSSVKVDINQNNLIDEEDRNILISLVDAQGDPYAAEDSAKMKGLDFPRPRELYRYLTLTEYHARPLWALPYNFECPPGLEWMKDLHHPSSSDCYLDKLQAELYDEAVRFDQGWRKRETGLLPVESDYAKLKFARAGELFRAGEHYRLLLALMELTEDAETLTQSGQPEISLKILTFRDHLRSVLGSQLYSDFEKDKVSWKDVLKEVAKYINADLGMEYNFDTLGPSRNLTNLQNYLQRAEWQYYKSARSEDDFRALIRYAQNDRRYLRAVSRTSRSFEDVNVVNHNLPMVLLFREALRIEGGDKKKAVGLLDESIRIPYAWIKTIPRESLPSSLALDNFLLPGNKEDGADKSRHWNVFGGICLYKSPQDALDLALKREIQDLRDDNYSKQAMKEFFRDMIGNLNGMYHIMTVNPELLQKK